MQRGSYITHILCLLIHIGFTVNNYMACMENRFYVKMNFKTPFNVPTRVIYW